MNLSANQRIIIVVVFALYTIALLAYSLVTRKSMKMKNLRKMKNVMDK